MNFKPVIVVLLLAFVILAGVPESLAKPEYLTSLNTVYGNGLCDICHVNGNRDGSRTPYGTSFENQPNHSSDPGAALKAIGAPPSATPTLTPIITMTPAATATPAVTTVTTKGTPAAPGFGIVASLVGLIAIALLVKRNNK